MAMPSMDRFIGSLTWKWTYIVTSMYGRLYREASALSSTHDVRAEWAVESLTPSPSPACDILHLSFSLSACTYIRCSWGWPKWRSWLPLLIFLPLLHAHIVDAVEDEQSQEANIPALPSLPPDQLDVVVQVRAYMSVVPPTTSCYGCCSVMKPGIHCTSESSDLCIWNPFSGSYSCTSS